MYTNHFGFREKPFNVTPDPRFVYMNPAFREAYASLLSGIRERKGFVVLTGEVGTGKTTLLRVLMKNLEATVRFVYFYNTTLSFEELLTYACEELGLETGSGGRLKKIQALNDFLIDQLRRGGTAALLIDEAQHLSEHVLENLRLLSNLETATEKLLQIVLVGQPELGAKLAQPSLRQLKQRVSVQCRIDRLKDREIPAYIQFRLESVGGQQKDLFGRQAVERITHYSNGIPRLINIICDNALTIAYATSQKAIGAAIIEEVAEDLRLKDPEPEPEPAPARPAPRAAAPLAEPASTPVLAAPPAATPAVATVPGDAEPVAERPAEPRAPSVARRERGRPSSTRHRWLTGGAVAAAVLAGAGLANSSRLIDAAGAARAAGREAVTVVTAHAAQAWQGLASQVGSLTASPNGVSASGATERSGPVAEVAAPAESRPAISSSSPSPAVVPAAPPAPMVSAAPVTAGPTSPVAPAPAPAVPGSSSAPAPVPPPAAVAPAPTTSRSGPPAPKPQETAAPPAAPRLAAVPVERRPTPVAAMPTRPADQRPVVIPQGGTVSDIAFRTYGHYSTLAVDLIKEFNPHIADLDWIRTGDRLWLPPLTRETMTRPQADGSYRLILGSFLSPVAAAKLGDAIRRRGLDAHVTPRPVTGQLTLYRVEIAGVTTRDAAEGIWRTALANCWIFISDAPCERTNP